MISVFVEHLLDVLAWVLNRHYVCLFNTCGMYSQGVLNRHNKKQWRFEILNLRVVRLVGMVWVFWCQNVNLYRRMHWLKRNLAGLLKNHIRPYYDCIACIFNKNRSSVLKWFQDIFLCAVFLRVSRKMAYKMREI